MKINFFNLFLGLSLLLILSGFIISSTNTSAIESNKISQDSQVVELNNYIEYSDQTLESTKLLGQSLLYFAATTWCQSCSKLEEEILQRQIEIPNNIHILKVDYDSDTIMNQKWGVTAQHTLILLNEEGQEIKRWLGGDFDTLLHELGNL